MSEVVQLDCFRKHRDDAPRSVIIAHSAPEAVAIKPRVYKTPDREKRKEMWREAEMLHRFYSGLADLAFAAQHAFEDYQCRDARPLAHYGQMEHWHPLVDKRQEATQRLMLTPAPTMADLNVKRRLRSQHHHGVDKATGAKIDALIEADQVWLIANAGHRARRRRS